MDQSAELVDLVLKRIETGKRTMTSYRRKNKTLRRFLAGEDPINEVEQTDPDSVEIEAFAPEHQSIFVSDLEAGRSNYIGKAIRALAFKTAYRYPDIEITGIDWGLAELNSAYLKNRLGAKPEGCDAIHHMRSALIDYLSGGFGAIYVALDNMDKPCIKYVDTLRITYDFYAHMPQDAKWVSMQFTEPYQVWADMFGEAEVAAAFGDLKNDKDPDRPTAVEFYYDISNEYGGNGVWAVFAVRGPTSLNKEPIYIGENPYYRVISNKRIPIIPVEFMFFMTLPSMRLPVGVIEAMIPSQMAIWDADRQLRDTARYGSPYYVVPEGFLTEDSENELRDGKIASILYSQAGMQGEIVQGRPLDISQATIAFRNLHTGEIQGQSGVAAFTYGTPVDAPFSSQTAAMQQESGLVEGVISKDVSEMWERVCRTLLICGAIFDVEPIDLNIQGHRMEFGGTKPIRDLLTPWADLRVKEDSSYYVGDQQAVQQAMLKLQTVAQFAPQGVKIALEDALQKMGEQNPKRITEAPVAPTAMPPAMGMPMTQQATPEADVKQ